ncbi:PadR family transcriptional regulator [Georgenia subflava]|uniref:PadR family transcriptional regulator n=1 Tax=Georgenia subflava TaxID=1622177 RepID=A0A6N7EGQ1_9MICO|nr:helix-turn-helix transcriptional regulator [Georgenia subflava]MPV35867.1 PadR family transcriptional regulator [Georgenia subflava]
MSVRLGLLALLGEHPTGVYQLRKDFEVRTGGTWPLNIGQVYATIQRLDRDGLVEMAGELDGVELYRLTEAGTTELAGWWAGPVERGHPGRDELAIKIALAVSAPGVDVAAVVQTQRTESMRALRDYTRLKARAGTADRDELAWSLVLDNLIFATEAEVRWLDHIEAAVVRAARQRTTAPAEHHVVESAADQPHTGGERSRR